eukprot:1855244-Pyramimonas_sp.AAC.1
MPFGLGAARGARGALSPSRAPLPLPSCTVSPRASRSKVAWLPVPSPLAQRLVRWCALRGVCGGPLVVPR